MVVVSHPFFFCDKYCHLGVKLVNKREFGDNRYGMICENP